MIPAFPEFKAVELADRLAVEAFTGAYQPYSDFNFTSLWAWDVMSRRLLSRLNDNLIVQFTDYASQEPFLSFLGVGHQAETARMLLEHARKAGLRLELGLVPEISATGLPSSDFDIVEDRDNFDYVYSVVDLAALSGACYKRSRNLQSRFSRDHPAARVEVVADTKGGLETSILAVLARWQELRRSAGKQVDGDGEEVSLRRLLRSDLLQHAILTVLTVDDHLVAFSVDELLGGGYAIAHFLKADSRLTGVYDYFLKERAGHLKRRGAVLLNVEQDLGLEGLRRAKLSMNPIHFLKKYRVRLR